MEEKLKYTTPIIETISIDDLLQLVAEMGTVCRYCYGQW